MEIQQSLTGFTHLRIWLDAKHATSRLQQQFSQLARSRPDIGHDTFRSEAAIVPQQFQNFWGITWPVTNIILHSTGESFGGSKHDLSLARAFSTSPSPPVLR